MTASTPEPLTGAEVGALREVAEGATPGPWHVCEPADGTDSTVASADHDPVASLLDEWYEIDPNEPTAVHDAAFIAAANPATILRLLALAEDHARLVGVVAAVEALADRWTRDGLTHGRLLRAALDTTATKEGS